MFLPLNVAWGFFLILLLGHTLASNFPTQLFWTHVSS